MKKFNGESLNIVEDNIQKLKEIFPEVFTEDKIDFDVLKSILGEKIEEGLEKYSFTWNGKSRARQIAQEVSTGTLRPVKEDSKNWDNTENIYIEGDNLEVLKLLQKSYYGKIKMIYIDPPYNTGKDFIYKDNFNEEKNVYLEQTGQKSGGGYLTTNLETSGRYHSDWLSMMYPRLKLARNLLSEDGVIFISIDDNEQANLKKLCDEIFGGENFVANIIWQKKFSPQNDAMYFSNMHDYILCYAKIKKREKNSFGWERKLLSREVMPKNYSNPDNDPKGYWSSGDFTAEGPTENCIYEIISPKGIAYIPPAGKRWVYNKENYEVLKKENRFWFGKNGDAFPRIKRYWNEVQQGLVPNTIWFYEEVGHTQEAKQECNKLFEKAIFDYPKSVKLLKRILNISVSINDIILDFFSGSATTAHSVMQLNAEDGGNRKYIMVQLDEKTDENSEAYKAGYKNICEIGKERIRRAGEKIKADESLPLENREKLDTGFKVFKLDSSNIKEWDTEVEELREYLFETVDNIKSDRTSLDILYEILLKYGLDLNIPIKENEYFYSIASGSLIVNLNKEINLEIIEKICEEYKKLKEIDEDFKTTVVLRDSSFKNDVDKTNAIHMMKQIGINDVRSI